MPDKIFAGPRIRRIRTAQGLSQTAMAAALGISPSYLNLLERNQRPLTVQLMVKLASAYGVEADELAGESGLLPALRAAFADPLLATELPGDSELVDFAEATPNAAGAMVKLHRAYREQAERLSDLGELLAKEGRAGLLAGARLPLDEVREVLERQPNHFAGLEEAAEAIGETLEGRDELSAALKLWLRREHGLHVQSLPAATMPSWRRRYDRHSQRLFVSERLSAADQLGEIALEAFLLGAAEALAQAVEALRLSTDEARRITRMELARYGASAILMPQRPFGEAARRTRFDVGALAARFRVSFAQAAARLTTLARPNGTDVPFFLLEVDGAGNRLRRAGATGFPISRFGGACPKLALYRAFAQPGQALAQAAEMPDGARYLLVARTVEGLDFGWSEHPRRTALLFGCDWSHAQAVAYADLLPRNTAGEPVFLPAGPACRLCERAACPARAEPPITRPLGLDEAVSGLSSFDFQ
ncbi:MAG: Cro/Cl family transcriptional regulator [Mesorhizobium amorphae]|nr:MAG: Cro/Cl family transcriptional regulator [Mesorhizobium amorphae]